MRTGNPGHTATGKRVAGCMFLRSTASVPAGGAVLPEGLGVPDDCGGNHPLFVEIYNRQGSHLGGWCPWCGAKEIDLDRVAEATHYIFTVLNGFAR